MATEDSSENGGSLLGGLRRGGPDRTWARIETSDGLAGVPDQQPWQAVVCHRAARIGVSAALPRLKEEDPNLPFLPVCHHCEAPRREKTPRRVVQGGPGRSEFVRPFSTLARELRGA